jgi:hypothetical protein
LALAIRLNEHSIAVSHCHTHNVLLTIGGLFQNFPGRGYKIRVSVVIQRFFCNFAIASFGLVYKLFSSQLISFATTREAFLFCIFSFTLYPDFQNLCQNLWESRAGIKK